MADGLALDVGLELDESSLNSFKGKLKGALGSVGSALKSGIGAVGGAVSAVGGAAKQAGTQIFDMASACAAAGDKIDKQSQALGLSREAYQEWDYILSQNGTSIDKLGPSMKKLTKLVGDAEQGSEKAAETFGALGISMSDLEGKSREEIFEMTVAGLQGVEDATEKAYLANELLGKSAQDMGALLNGSSESVQGLKDKAHDMGIVMEDEAVTASANFTDSIDNLTRTFSGVKNKAAAEFLPGITSVMDGFRMILSGDVDAGVETLSSGIESLVNSLGSLLNKGVQVIGDLLPTLLPSLGEAALNLLQGVMGVLTDNAEILASTVVEIVTMLGRFIVENLPLLIDAAIQMICALAEGLSDSVEELIPAAVEAILTIVETLIDNLPLLLKAAFTLIEALGKGLIDALPILIEKLPEIIIQIVDFITMNLPEIINQGVDIVLALATGIVQSIPQLVAQLPKLISALLTGIGGAIVGVVDIGKHIVEGLWEGIKSMGSWIKNKVTGFFGGIVDGVKKTLGIHSPSTVFASIGGYMSEGLGIGFEAEMPDIDKMVSSKLPNPSTLSTNIEVSETLRTSLSGANKLSNNKSNEKFGNIILEFNGNTFTDKQGLRKVANDLKSILLEDGVRTGSVVFG